MYFKGLQQEALKLLLSIKKLLTNYMLYLFIESINKIQISKTENKIGVKLQLLARYNCFWSHGFEYLKVRTVYYYYLLIINIVVFHNNYTLANSYTLYHSDRVTFRYTISHPEKNKNGIIAQLYSERPPDTLQVIQNQT